MVPLKNSRRMLLNWLSAMNTEPPPVSVSDDTETLAGEPSMAEVPGPPSPL
jgi:hypothetical protein